MTWKNLPEKDPSPPQRPAEGGHGTVGKKIALITNHFLVTVKDLDLMLFHYDVAIKNFNGEEFFPPLPKKKNMMIFEKMKECLPKEFATSLAYDSMKSACSTICFDKLKKPVIYKVKFDNGGGAQPQDKMSKSTYNVTMVLVNKVSLSQLFNSMKYVPGKKTEVDSTAVQMMEIMFRHNLARKFTQISYRNFYGINEEFAEHRPIGRGKLGVTGFFGSLRPAAWKDGSILLNLDMIHTAFYEPINLLDFIRKNNNNINFDATLDANRAMILTKELKDIKIKVIYSPNLVRTRKIKEVHTFGPRETEFEFTKGDETSMTTVEDYYHRQYNIKLKHPEFNCLNVGNQNKPVFIPTELCSIAKGQKVRKRLLEVEVRELIKIAAVKPDERLAQIKKVASINKFEDNELLKSMKFTISESPLEITGRVLSPPELTMGDIKISPRFGFWDAMNRKFHRPATLHTWAVINYDPTIKYTGDFIRTFVKMGRANGMTIADPYDTYDCRVARTEPNPSKDLKYYKENRPDIQLVLFVLPSTTSYYGAIKKVGDTEVNIITQCVKGHNVRNAKPQVIINIILKVNAKLDGVNNIITKLQPYNTGLMEFREAFLIMGADVNHPAAGSDTAIPSIVAVVGSYEINGVKYAMERREQHHRKEVIQEMKDITKNILNNFLKQAKRLPSRIIMFRDGVSESQFSTVLSYEMMAMRHACSEIHKDYTPGITFICVQKRHHTRLFCKEEYTQGRRNKNVPPGTIVDRYITHPTEIDFYLCSHEGIQGTSRPAHYHVLWDDNDLPINELQALTYKLCHVYSRCARSVSIPAPVYYAHLAALRASVYIPEILRNTRSPKEKGNGEIERQNEVTRAIRMTATEPSSMISYYI